MKKNRTVFAKKEEVKRDWYLVDAAGKTLGRISTRIAACLRGKHKPIFSPHVDCGDFVVVINAGKIRVTGGKEKKKFYFTHSGYPGGDKILNYKKMISSHPERVIKNAVWGMLPQNRLGRAMIKKLKVFAGPQHKHLSQKPEEMMI